MSAAHSDQSQVDPWPFIEVNATCKLPRFPFIASRDRLHSNFLGPEAGEKPDHPYKMWLPEVEEVANGTFTMIWGLLASLFASLVARSVVNGQTSSGREYHSVK